MSYESHVENLAKKVSKRLGLLKHISPYLKKHHERHSILALSSPPSCMVAWFGTAVILNVIKDFSNFKRGQLELFLMPKRRTPSIELFNNLRPQLHDTGFVSERHQFKVFSSLVCSYKFLYLKFLFKYVILS